MHRRATESPRDFGSSGNLHSGLFRHYTMTQPSFHVVTILVKELSRPRLMKREERETGTSSCTTCLAGGKATWTAPAADAPPENGSRNWRMAL